MTTEEFQKMPDNGERAGFPLCKVTSSGTPNDLMDASLEVRDLIVQLTGYAIAVEIGQTHTSILLPTITRTKFEAIKTHLENSTILQNGTVSLEIAAA